MTELTHAPTLAEEIDSLFWHINVEAWEAGWDIETGAAIDDLARRYGLPFVYAINDKMKRPDTPADVIQVMLHELGRIDDPELHNAVFDLLEYWALKGTGWTRWSAVNGLSSMDDQRIPGVLEKLATLEKDAWWHDRYMRLAESLRNNHD